MKIRPRGVKSPPILRIGSRDLYPQFQAKFAVFGEIPRIWGPPSGGSPGAQILGPRGVPRGVPRGAQFWAPRGPLGPPGRGPSPGALGPLPGPPGGGPTGGAPVGPSRGPPGGGPPERGPPWGPRSGDKKSCQDFSPILDILSKIGGFLMIWAFFAQISRFPTISGICPNLVESVIKTERTVISRHFSNKTSYYMFSSLRWCHSSFLRNLKITRSSTSRLKTLYRFILHYSTARQNIE